MSQDDDDDRTVFGQQIPQTPPLVPKDPAPPPDEDEDRTLIGMPVPPAPAGGQPPSVTPPQQPQAHTPQAPDPEATVVGAPPPLPPSSEAHPAPSAPPAQSPHQDEGYEETRIGGPIYAPDPPAPAPNPGPAPVPPPAALNAPGHLQQAPHIQGHGNAGGQHAPPHQTYSPGLNPLLAPAPVPPQGQAAGVKLPLAMAAHASGMHADNTANPLLAAAGDLLVFLGRIRTGMVEMPPQPLRDHIVQELRGISMTLHDQGAPRDDHDVALYALCSTADDILQNLPGSDRAYWQQYAISGELLQDRSTAMGFFRHLERVAGLGSRQFYVLELMLACLSLGFEGKFRAEPDGATALARLRQDIYHRIRAMQPREGQELSIRWKPVIKGGRRRNAALPIWLIGGIAAGMVAAMFATLSWVLSTEAQASQNQVLALHSAADHVDVQRTQVATPAPKTRAVYVPPPPAQLDRIRDKLAPQIEQGLVSVTTKGDYIVIRVGPELQFGSGSADLQSEFAPLARNIAGALDPEQGRIVIEGHSDNIPLSGTGRYKSNEQLSEARAASVRGVLAPFLTDASRVSVIGVGPNDPLDTANTPQARAKNRRVDILITQEQKL